MYSRILVATDGSPLAEKGLEQGLALAKALGAEVIVVTVSERWTPLGVDAAGLVVSEYALIEEFEKTEEAAAKVILAAAAKAATAAGVKATTIYAGMKFPATAIVEIATEQRADLIVMASHGRRGLDRILLGSQTNEVLTHSSIPVLVVK